MKRAFRCVFLPELLLLAVLGLPLHAMAVESTAPSGASDAIATPEQRLRRNEVKELTGIGDDEFRSFQTRGLDGDGDAAHRVALMFKRGSNGLPRDERSMLQWLLHASSLNNGAASYDLYIYFLEQRLDRDAVYFERRALEQGFVPPPRLDPRRG